TARAFRAPMQDGIPHSLIFDRLLKCAWKSWPTAEESIQESAKFLCFFQEIRSRRSVRSAKQQALNELRTDARRILRVGNCPKLAHGMAHLPLVTRDYSQGSANSDIWRVANL